MSDSLFISNAGFSSTVFGVLVRCAPVLILTVSILAAFAGAISFAKSEPTKTDRSGFTLPSLSSVLDSVSVVSFSDPVSSEMVTAWNTYSKPSWINFCHCFRGRQSTLQHFPAGLMLMP